MTRAPRTSTTDPLRVDFLPQQSVALKGRIGLTFAPGKKDPEGGPWERDLDADLDRLRRIYRSEVLVCLLERGEYVADELELLGIADLFERARARGLELDWAPMRDGGAPSDAELLPLVRRILGAAREGKTVVLCCRGGLGRSGTVAACCLIGVGASAREAMETVRSVRPGAIETEVQERCVRAFDEQWCERAMRGDPLEIIDPFLTPGADDDPESRPTPLPARRSQPGIAPISYSGAATICYLGLDDDAREAGVPDGSPLREGDLFHLLPGRSLTIGRGNECDVAISSGQLSRTHTLVAYVKVLDQQIVVADLRSRNGTWIGGEQIDVRLLGTGVEFVLAKAYRFRFESIG